MTRYIDNRDYRIIFGENLFRLQLDSRFLNYNIFTQWKNAMRPSFCHLPLASITSGCFSEHGEQEEDPIQQTGKNHEATHKTLPRQQSCQGAVRAWMARLLRIGASLLLRALHREI
ncbi:MAG: hypothetical protein QM665_11400 [Desulfovibrio sp.]